jgi:hypothetical protein
MIDRRVFLGTLGASAALSAVPLWHRKERVAASGCRKRITLNGEWERYVGGSPLDVVTVPSSLRPSGFYTLKRDFVLPGLTAGERAFLHFEGITYCGKLAVNGRQLGLLGPYVPYEFEVTDFARNAKNEVEVQIADLVPWPDNTGKYELAIGVNQGWEAYSGIIRDAWVEIRPASFVENVRLAYQLDANLESVTLRPRVTIASRDACRGEVKCVLLRNGTAVAETNRPAQFAPGSNEIEVSFDLQNASLWSPDEPNLYELKVSLQASDSHDTWTCRTGFREIRVQGNEFLLNGKRLVLNGVCRHDMWKDQGFTLTGAQQEQDMRMIKKLGCNFVRLVHYPHERRIIELCDELGLLVSEEPGFWGVDFRKTDREQVELGFQVLETTIRRDWNSPSVMAWLLCNECDLVEGIMREGKQRCNAIDPLQRLVSVANDKDTRIVKFLFEAAGMDFFDQHPYTFNVNQFNKEVKSFGSGKPLTFTEWGGKAIGQTPGVMRKEVDRLGDLVDSGEISAHMFWSWQDVRQYSRVDAEVRDGVLETGVVTEARDIREPVYRELARLFRRGGPGDETRASEPVSPPPRGQEITQSPALCVLPLGRMPVTPVSKFAIVDLQAVAESHAAKQSWTVLESNLKQFWAKTPMARDQWARTGGRFRLWPSPVLEVGGIPFRSAVVDGYVRPLVLTAGVTEFTIPIGRECWKLHFLGQVTLPRGYPLRGQLGETVATYSIVGEDGSSQELAVRNGYEVAQANCIHDATRIDPIAVEAQPALEFIKDAARERYRFFLWSVPVKSGRIQKIICRLHNGQPALAILSITTE